MRPTAKAAGNQLIGDPLRVDRPASMRPTAKAAGNSGRASSRRSRRTASMRPTAKAAGNLEIANLAADNVMLQ